MMTDATACGTLVATAGRRAAQSGDDPAIESFDLPAARHRLLPVQAEDAGNTRPHAVANEAPAHFHPLLCRCRPVVVVARCVHDRSPATAVRRPALRVTDKATTVASLNPESFSACPQVC